MRRGVARIKGLGFILWHARHNFYHVMVGLVWAWFLRERWHEFNARWIWLSVFGSLLPDVDHMIYFWGYGRNDGYTKQIKAFLKNKQWRLVTLFMETGHKHNTNLSWHNYYFMLLLFALALVSSVYEWRVGVILFGAMLLHYLFDIADDVLTLGAINPNWKRWGREKIRASGH
ncbi:metal-dependent hydrolase [Candidatus Gottesmanbacteria bacterium]|nr:metal-dependent hydrolase [Candidatus Gottesmanbacteria bacterium]